MSIQSKTTVYTLKDSIQKLGHEICKSQNWWFGTNFLKLIEIFLTKRHLKQLKEHPKKYQWHEALISVISVMRNFASQALYNINVHSILLHSVNILCVNKIPNVINGIKCLSFCFSFSLSFKLKAREIYYTRDTRISRYFTRKIFTC